MLRVPMGQKSFIGGLGAYQRALTRQLEGDVYDLVYCADLFSAEIAAKFKERQGFTLHVEVDDFPAVSFAKRYHIDASDAALRKTWKSVQRRGLRAADKIIAMSRYAARVVSEHADPRKVELIGRAVNRKIFAPPSVELDFDGRRTVTIFERRGPTDRVNAALAILNEVSRKTRSDEVRLILLGATSSEHQRIVTELRRMEIRDRVDIEEAHSAAATAAILATSDVVVVPSCAESAMVPLATPHRALEAMACGRATILTGPDGAFRDVITPNVHAKVVQASAPTDVALAVLELLEDEKARRKMGRAGADRVEQTCDLRTRNADFATSVARALGVEWSPREGDDEDGRDEDLSKHEAQVAEEPRDRTVTNVRLSEVAAMLAADRPNDFIPSEDVIEISESNIGRAPTGPAFLIPEADRERFPSQIEKTRATLTDDIASEPDVQRVQATPNPPRRPAIGEPSTESGAFVGSPRGEPLKLPHFAKALQVPSEVGERRETTARHILVPQDPPTEGVRPMSQTGTQSAVNPAGKSDGAPTSDEEALMPSPTPKAEVLASSVTREPTVVNSTAALEIINRERQRQGREKTVELDKQELLKRQQEGDDDWAPDTVADATPFEVPTRTVKGSDESGPTHDRGLLVERDPDGREVTIEESVRLASSERSEA